MKEAGILDAALQGRSIESWIEEYEASHQHPVNRAFHYMGIPLIVLSLPLFLIIPLVPRFWKVPVSLFALGWVFQLAGHAIEGRPPEFLKDRRFLQVGLRWWLSRVLPRR